MKRSMIRIILKSALSVGSGYSYAGVIDGDICYDNYGLPYIPAKRLKGCLRDVAEKQLYAVLEHRPEELFGFGGNDRTVGVSIGNAHMLCREEIVRGIQSLKNSDDELSKLTDKQAVLNQFTSVKAQTRLVEGVADDNSLRYTRTVNEISPIDDRPMEFIAPVEYEEALENDLNKIVKGLRNIGIMRNRGFGSVICSLESQTTDGMKCKISDERKGDKCVISYSFTNVDPLMISASGDDKSIKYIPGQNVLGLLATRYLKREGTSAEDKRFRDLFLNGETVYTNAVPYDGKHWYYPAPAFVNKLKKTKEYVNIEAAAEGNEYDGGNIPKKLYDKFVATEDGRFAICDVDMRITYHHNQREKNDDGSVGKLYSHLVIAEDQKFAGRIITRAEYADILVEMLSEEDLKFGKSKSAQYGRCMVDSIKVEGYETNGKSVNAGDVLLVTFLSDAIFLGEHGYTVDYDTVVKGICNDLGIEEDTSDVRGLSLIKTKMLYGYNTKWNMRKQPIPAIEAGSTYVIKTRNESVISRDFIGERNLEGYGNILVMRSSEIPHKINMLDEKSVSGGGKVVSAQLKKIITSVLLESILDNNKKVAVSGNIGENSVKMKISPSLRGRLTLMLTESIDNYPNDEEWKERVKDFGERVESIKSDDRTKIVKALQKEMIAVAETEEGNKYDILIENLCSEAYRNVLTDKLGYSSEEVNEMIGPMWSKVLMTMLVNDKYMKGDE